MTQSIVVQVGQCGNQIGQRFWDLALREHASYNKNGLFDESMQSFFRNVDSKSGQEIPVGTGKEAIRGLRARSVLVDMEEGVVNDILNGPLREIFDTTQLVTDVSGSGNNWATGHKEYGFKYKDELLEVLRKAAEQCDCLQCFFVLHSMGGGTGSGLGTYVLQLLSEEFPDVHRHSVTFQSLFQKTRKTSQSTSRCSPIASSLSPASVCIQFVTALYPSVDDDVITSPYNTVLAMQCLTEFADCVLPVENQALVDIVNKACAGQSRKVGGLTDGAGCVGSSAETSPFDSMNNIVANLLLNMTSSSRFEGSLNVDLNEIVMNLVPFPSLHYIVSSQTPLYALADVRIPPRRLDQMFTDAFAPEYQLIKADPKHSLYLACALMVRGNVEVSDIRRNIERLRTKLNFIHWNQEGWKTGLCSVAPVGVAHSLLTLSNNTCIRHTFNDIVVRFNRLYKRKAHLHHYTHVDGMELSDFSNSLESLTGVIKEYETLDQQMTQPPPQIPRLRLYP